MMTVWRRVGEGLWRRCLLNVAEEINEELGVYQSSARTGVGVNDINKINLGIPRPFIILVKYSSIQQQRQHLFLPPFLFFPFPININEKTHFRLVCSFHLIPGLSSSRCQKCVCVFIRMCTYVLFLPTFHILWSDRRKPLDGGYASGKRDIFYFQNND